MRIRTDDLFALADALVVLRDPDVDILYRQKIADKLEEIYWRALEAWQSEYYSSRRAYQRKSAVKS